MHTKTVLDNGLRVVTATMPHTRSVSVCYFIGTGSRYETEEQAGISHFIEHLLFKGNSRRPTSRDISVAIEGVGGSLNGPALLETLRSLSPGEAASTDTYEGYSAWSVALHVLYLKHVVCRELVTDLPPYQYEETDFPKPPPNPDQAAWDSVIQAIEAVHHVFTRALAEASAESLAKVMESWKIPVGTAAAWLVSHDVAHNAQIRNMGLTSLRQKAG